MGAVKKRPTGAGCRIRKAPDLSRDLSRVITVSLHPSPPPSDIVAARDHADREAARQPEEFMLLSCYDRDRNFETPQHVSECSNESAIPGYVEYALSRGATLRVNVDEGRFIFFYVSVPG